MCDLLIDLEKATKEIANQKITIDSIQCYARKLEKKLAAQTSYRQYSSNTITDNCASPELE